jgi:ribosomal protein S18 acetylase RimI-like enzyme
MKERVTPHVELVQMELSQLRDTAEGKCAVFPSGVEIAEGALPPPRAAFRCLAALADGCPLVWGLPFAALVPSLRLVVGAVTFKGPPISGSVEIGYGVSPAHRGNGYGTAMIKHLLRHAAVSGQVREVVALVAPDNAASAQVVSRAGFACGETIIDTDGESVVRWSWACGA